MLYYIARCLLWRFSMVTLSGVAAFYKMSIFEARILCIRVTGIDMQKCQFLKIIVSNTRELAQNMHIWHDKSTFSHNWTKFIWMHGIQNSGFDSFRESTLQCKSLKKKCIFGLGEIWQQILEPRLFFVIWPKAQIKIPNIKRALSHFRKSVRIHYFEKKTSWPKHPEAMQPAKIAGQEWVKHA